ncbi:MAG: RNA polymerase subunit sigma-24 [Clostridiaceae bacterium BRH_c20a]|nr:MAG: RNA polymerase subunit sigma-24 [Clostridiaceae bacterium BRH_c20a]
MRDETLEQLILEEVKLVYKYLKKMGASKEDTEDIVQETIYMTFKNIDSIDKNKIRAWLFKVAINNYYNLYNKKKKQNNISFSDLEYLKIFNESTEDNVLIEEKRRYIEKALDLLKPSYKELLVFKYVMDLSYRDIASIFDMKEEKIKVYLYRARNKFKEIWEGLDIG